MEPILAVKIDSFDTPVGYQLLCFDPDPKSRYVVGWSPDAGLTLHHFSGGLIASDRLELPPLRARLALNGGLIVLTKERQVRIYRVNPTAATLGLAEPTSDKLPGDVRDVAWTPSGSLLAVGLTDGHAFIASRRPGDEWALTSVPNFGRPIREILCASRCIVVTLEPPPDEAVDDGDDPDRTRGLRTSYPAVAVYAVSSDSGVTLAQSPILTTNEMYAGPTEFSEDGRHLWYYLGDKVLSMTNAGLRPWSISARRGQVGFGARCMGYVAVNRRREDRLVVCRLSGEGPIPWGDQYAPSGLRSLTFADGADATYAAWLLSDKVEICRLVHPDVFATYDEDPERRLAAVQRVGEQRVAEGVQRLLNLAKEGSDTDRSVIVPALLAIDTDEAIDAVLSLDAEDPHVQRGLHGLDMAKARAAVERCMASRRRSTTLLGVASMLLRRPDVPGTLELCQILLDRAPQVRAVAAMALAVRKDPDALVPLVAALNDPDDEVASQVWTAILTVLPGDHDVEPPQPFPGLGSVDAFVQHLRQLGSIEKAREVVPAGWTILRDISAALVGEAQPPQPFGDSSESSDRSEPQAIGQAPPESDGHFRAADLTLNALKDLGRRDRHRAIALALCLMAASQLRGRRARDQELAFLTQAAEHCSSLDAPEVEWRVHGAIADCHAFGNRWREADEEYFAAENVIQRMWARLLGEPDDRHFFADKARLFDDAMLCRLRLGRPANALDTVERAKTRFLGDLIARRHHPPQERLEEVDEEFWEVMGERRALSTSVLDDRDILTRGEIVDVSFGDRVEGDAVLPAAFAALVVVEPPARPSDIRMVTDLWLVVAVLQHDDVPSDVEDATRAALVDIAAGLADMRTAAEAPEHAGGQDAVARYEAGALALSNLPLPPPPEQTPQSPLPGWALYELRAWAHPYVGGDAAFSPLVDALLEVTTFASGEGVVLGTLGPVAGIEPGGEGESEGVRLVFSIAAPGQTGIDGEKHPTATTAVSQARASRWKYVSQLARGASAGVPDAARMLCRLPDTALVQFALTRSGTVIYLFSPQADLDGGAGLPDLDGFTGPSVFTIPGFTQLDLHERIYGANGWMALYRRRIADRESWQRSTDQLLGELYEALFRPIRCWLAERRTKRLLVVPHRGLHLLPVSAWYDRQQRRRRYVGDQFEVSHAPSLTLLKVCAERLDDRSRLELTSISPLVLLDPTCNLPIARMDALAVRPPPAPSRILSGTGATLDKMLESSGSADPLHFAGHGKYLPDDPLGSRLELADGNLTIGELFDEHTSIVSGARIVLPACETSMTDYADPADEHLGIASGFLFGGGACVLSTQWAVDELAAAMLVARYYEALEDKSPAAALAEAQRKLRTASRRDLRRLMGRIGTIEHLGLLDERSRSALDRVAQGLGRHRFDYSHPVFWAAFTVTAAPPAGSNG
ncbi:hypothetical protein GCM10027053_26180 [Intrasporangium mesophilum]